MNNDYRKFRELYHGEIKQNSWKAPKVQTGDGSLYRISLDRSLTDADSQLEFKYYTSHQTNASIKNAQIYLKKQAGILYTENKEYVDQRLLEVKKLRLNNKFLEECFKRMDSYPEDSRSFNLMRSIIFQNWHSLIDKYSSDSLKYKRRQIEKDNRTYNWNINTILNDIVGEEFQHSCCESPMSDTKDVSFSSYKWTVRDAIDGQRWYPDYYEYKFSEETEISDEIAKLYEKSRNIKLPLEG